MEARAGLQETRLYAASRRLTSSFRRTEYQAVTCRLSNLPGDPPGKIKAPASAGTEARAHHSMRADGLGDDTASAWEAQFPILMKHWWRDDAATGVAA
jgi:hypothetical protein